MIQIVVFVPKDHKEVVKDAMFKAGAGKLGNYDHCSFEHLGLGQFRPLAESRPHLGQLNTVEQVEEVRIEMICPEEAFSEVVKAMKAAHPYETPAYYGTKVVR